MINNYKIILIKINNVLDISNFIMIEFEFIVDKNSVKLTSKDEKITTLENKNDN